MTETRPTDELMFSARFDDVEVIDVTETFLQTAHAWRDAFNEHETELQNLLRVELEERQRNVAGIIEGIEDELLQRLLVTGTAPT